MKTFSRQTIFSVLLSVQTIFFRLHLPANNFFCVIIIIIIITIIIIIIIIIIIYYYYYYIYLYTVKIRQVILKLLSMNAVSLCL